MIYAGPGAEADALIESLLRRYSGKSSLVVSSDRRVLKAARAARARSLTSDKFLRQLVLDQSTRRASVVPPKPDAPVSPGQVRDWARQMGIAPDDPLWSLPASSVPMPRSRAGGVEPPAPQPARPPSAPERGPAPVQQPSARQAPQAPGRIDPLILEAMKEWPGRIELDDLDMSKWLTGDIQTPQRENQ